MPGQPVVCTITLQAQGRSPVKGHLWLLSYREKELWHILHLTAPKVFSRQHGNRRYNPLATLQCFFDEGQNIDVVLVEDYEHTDHDPRYLNLQNYCEPLIPSPDLHAVALSAVETAIMFLSSGTTRLPKTIARKNGGSSYMIECGCDVFALDNHSVYFAVMPVSHGFVINCPAYWACSLGAEQRHSPICRQRKTRWRSLNAVVNRSWPSGF